MTKKEKIKMLELELEGKNQLIVNITNDNKKLSNQNVELNDTIADAKRVLKEFMKADEATPKDCKRGSWCKACEFNKSIRVPFGMFGYREEYFCGKEESCSNFVQREF